MQDGDVTMSVVNIKIIIWGQVPYGFNKTLFENCNSSIFTIIDDIESYQINVDSDISDNWGFSDQLIQSQLPERGEEDILLAITNVPLELDWYVRRLSSKRAIFTYHEMKDILSLHNIPIENLLMKVLYSYSLAFLTNGKNLPESVIQKITHDETRGCLYDMTGIKTDICLSCQSPTICSQCQNALQNKYLSKDMIEKAKDEIKNKIKKTLYYRIVDKIKKHPIKAGIVSKVFALILGIISSVIGSQIILYFFSD